ncbi:uncharacterized protein F4822DRAFT_441771 [Hypoxylon trugodes]|uniref:uncharacterized protein n=1 Tax=Hypoxylon trugodes TaxID=326681 RepID=UPI002195377E|nr:uncharacterized protein F4822DRAFT_441771 [Hypoxylon trugodes]KAI1393086.1 hypothetical protein F4822DRAFT_441771 [Hypoxylon trugodes]
MTTGWHSSLDDLIDVALQDTFSADLGTNLRYWSQRPGSEDRQQEEISLMMNLTQPTSYHTAGNGLTLSPMDHRAIQYYSTAFSGTHVLDTPASFTNNQLLQLSGDAAVVMRLLLATSFNEMSHVPPDTGQEMGQLAEQHFQAGSCLFAHIIGRGEKSQEDHLSILASVFLSYIYLSRRKAAARESIRTLSKIISKFASQIKLYETYAEPEPGSSQVISIPSRKRSLLSRLVRWNFFKDIQMSFHGCGGDFASYINRMQNHTEELHYNSYALLDEDWTQPISNADALEFIQSSSVMHCIYNVFTIMHDINEYSENPDVQAIAKRIRIKIERFERTYASLIHLASSHVEPRNPPLINIDFTIARFHAIIIYFFRASNSTSETWSRRLTIPPITVQRAMTALLTIAYRTFNSPLPTVRERLHWPLFMAGIETQDPIHRSWILSHMRRSALRTALKRVISRQEKTGNRLPMQVIKYIASNVDDEWGDLIEGESLGIPGSLMVLEEPSDGNDNNFCLW